MKKRRKKMGEFYKINFPNSTHSYCRVLKRGYVAFYKILTKRDLPLEEFERQEIQFIVNISCFPNNPFINGQWELIGYLKIKNISKYQTLFFWKNNIFKDVYYIHDNFKGPAIKANYEQIKNLEISMEWTPADVEKRLFDELNNRTNVLHEEKRKEFIHGNDFLMNKKFDIYRDIAKAIENKDLTRANELLEDSGIKKMVQDLDKMDNNIIDKFPGNTKDGIE